jgi:hypothetical protein
VGSGWPECSMTFAGLRRHAFSDAAAVRVMTTTSRLRLES